MLVAIAPGVAPTAAQAQSSTAPLVTEDGIGVRIDRTAIDGPVLDLLEAELDAFANDQVALIATGDDAPFQSHRWFESNADLDLSFDVIPPGGALPDGGFEIHADIRDVEIHWRMNGFWLTGQCSIWARPDDGTVTITAKIDQSKLPGASPLVLHDVSATWDDDPDLDYDWNCAGHIWLQGFLNWWDDIWDSSDPESTAAMIEREVQEQAEALVDGLWADYVAPVLDTAADFGAEVSDVYTDAHGLIITADTDASGADDEGITIPGLGGPYDVTNTRDSGADSDVHALLANRTVSGQDSHVIVSIHPNVVNQFMNAMHQFQNGSYGAPAMPASIKEVLLHPDDHGLFNDVGWFARMTSTAPPHTEPTGTGGAPQLQIPGLSFVVSHSSVLPPPFGQPIATFEGTMSGIDLITEVRPGGGGWGPGFSADGAEVDLTLVQARPQVWDWDPDPDDMLPFVQLAFDNFNDSIFVQFLTLAPLDFTGVSIDLCETCGRYADDDRWTETFHVS